MVSAASEGLGCKAMVMDFGGSILVDIFVDASAAIGVAQRKGPRGNTPPRYTGVMDPRCSASAANTIGERQGNTESR